jgi:hypothetical protein
MVVPGLLNPMPPGLCVAALMVDAVSARGGDLPCDQAAVWLIADDVGHAAWRVTAARR